MYRGILFLFFSSVPQKFSANCGFDTFQSGLIQLAITVGALIGTAINPIADMLYPKSAARNTENPGVPIPEARLFTAIPGAILFTAGLFWYGWTSQPQYHWIIPTAGIACVGLGIYSIYMGVVNYLTDAYEKFAASALSAASLGRNVFGAFLPLASYQLFENLGFGWAVSLLGFIGLALSCVPVILVFKGRVCFMHNSYAASHADHESRKFVGDHRLCWKPCTMNRTPISDETREADLAQAHPAVLVATLDKIALSHDLLRYG